MEQIVSSWTEKDKKESVMFTRHMDFIRHGEYIKTSDNKTQLLTELGQTQAQKTGQILTQQLRRPIFIHSSDLTRAKQTTEILMTNMTEHDPVLTYNDIFQEVGFKSCPPYIPTDFHHFTNEAYYKRAVDALNSILSFNKEYIWYEKETTCTYVCHKNIIQFLVARILNVPLIDMRKEPYHHCGVTYLKETGNKVEKVYYNKTYY